MAAKAPDFMVNMKFSDSCIGFAYETKQCSCLVQFLGEEIIPSDAKMAAFHIIYRMALPMMMMKR